jgi:hypothetical protein
VGQPEPATWRAWSRVVFALALGTAGGWVFVQLRLPLPWMLGAMLFNMVAATAGAPVGLSFRLRTVMVAVLGVMLGSSFRPELLDQAILWLPSLATVVLFVALATAVSYAYFRRVARYDPVTAYYASAPGGLNEMILIGAAAGGDDRAISLTHASRIFLTVMLIPTAFQAFGGYQPANRPNPFGSLLDADLGDLALLAACGVAGFLGARAARVPAFALVGPAAVSAGLHVTGASSATLPAELVAAAQVVVGSAVGCRFAGVGARSVLRGLAYSLGSLVLLLAVTAALCYALHAWLGLYFPSLILAFSPGGLAEMSLVALALGLDPAFVTSHHVFRIFVVVLLVPLAFKLLARMRLVR